MLASTRWAAQPWAADLIVDSHAFIRRELWDNEIVSMRDLKRFTILAEWFCKNLEVSCEDERHRFSSC